MTGSISVSLKGVGALPLLITIASVTAVIAVLLLLPLSIHIKYENDFFAEIKIGGIKIYAVKPQKDIKKSTFPDTESDKKAEKQADGFFKKLKKKYGFAAAVKEIFRFAYDLLMRTKGTLKHIVFKKIKLKINVASADAAKTAIDYGTVCSAVYPVLAFIDTNARVKICSTDIKADFNTEKAEISFSGIISIRLVFLIAVLYSAFSEYNKFKSRNEL